MNFTVRANGNDWLDLPVYFGFEFKCRRNCTLLCTECFKNSFGVPPKIYFKNPPKKNNSHTAVKKADNKLENIPLHITGSIEVRRNTSSIKNISHKLIWKLPDKCLEEKCDICRNNSCCNYYGLFPFDFFATKCFLFSLLAVDQFTNIFN